MTSKSLGKKTAQKVFEKQPLTNKKALAVSKTSKNIVSESEESEGTFFKDSDEEMDWSEVDSDEESFDEDDSEEVDSEEEELTDSEEEEFIDSEEDGYMSNDSEIEQSDDNISVEISDDDESSEFKSDNLKEKDLVVPSAVSHAKNPLLQFFWKLSDAQKTVRWEAVTGLIQHIKSSQSVFDAPAEINISKKEKILSLYDSGSLAGKCCSDLTYTVKRLIKGLASTRDSSRLGFMLALLSVYHSFIDFLDAEVILNWSMKLTSPESIGGSVKRREERLLHVARIFALGALFRSKLGDSLSVESKQSAIDSLVSVGKKKSFLRESSLEVIIYVVDCAESKELSAYTLKKLSSSSTLMIETLTFAIIASTRFNLSLDKCEKDFPVILSEFSDLNNLLSFSNEEPLVNLLKEAPCFTDRLHSIWPLILKSLDNDNCFTSENFLNKIIESLFLNSTGLVKRWTGLNLLKQIIGMNRNGSIGFIFTPIVLRMIKGALGSLNLKSSAMAGKEVASFNAAVIDLFRELIIFAAENNDQASSEIAMDLILHLSKAPAGTSGNKILEQIAGDQAIVSKLYLRLTTANVIVLIDNIAKDISFNFNAQNQSIVSFQAPFDKLVGLVMNDNLVKLEKSSEWILHLVVVMAKICVEQNNGLSDELREIVKGRFFALLNELADFKSFSGINWIERVAKMFTDVSSGSNSDLFSLKIDEPISDALNHLKAIEKLLKKNKIEPERFSQAIVSLKDYLIILLFLDPIESIPVCADLAECLEAHFSSKSSKNSKNKSSLDSVMPVLIDILMAFLAKSSQLTRRMCDDIFRAVVPFLSVESLSVLFQILKTVDSDKDEIFEEIDDSMKISEDEMDEEIEEVGEGTINAIDNAMKSSHSAFESESELSDVDDDQMLAFDEKLIEIFKEKRKALSGSSSKARVQETKRSMIQFKFKVLELTNMAFKSGDLPVSVRIGSINGLLEVIFANLSLNGSSSNAEQKQFFSKLESFFAEAFGRPSRNPTQPDAVAAQSLICEIIEKICNEDNMISHAAVLPRAAQCVWYLIKICRSLKVDESEIKVHFSKLVKFAVSPKENCFRVLRSFVFTWSNWDLQYVAPLLASMPIELNALCVIGAIRPYQRNQVFEFFTSLIKRAQSFNQKESAMELLKLFSQIFTETYTPCLSEELKKMKVDFFKDDLKFIQFCYRKHREFNIESGTSSWNLVINTGLSNVEEFWKSQNNSSNSVKSFLGQLKSLKQ